MATPPQITELSSPRKWPLQRGGLEREVVTGYGCQPWRLGGEGEPWTPPSKVAIFSCGDDLCSVVIQAVPGGWQPYYSQWSLKGNPRIQRHKSLNTSARSPWSIHSCCKVTGQLRFEIRCRISGQWLCVTPDAGVLSQGWTHLQQARKLAQHPRYGLCWMAALGQLDVGCKELDEEHQSRIALAFAHCHLEKSGRSFPPCTPTASIRDCTQDMDPVAFGVYTEFFTHAQSICYFLQNEAWQQRAQDAVLRLASASEDVAHRLESTNQLAEETARAQNATLRSQEQILQDGELLRQTLKDSSQGVRQVFQDLKDSAVEQRVVFAEIFNHVAFLHRFVVGKSNAVYSVLFHLLGVAAILALTSSQRTSGARFILLALVGASIYLESVICSLLMDNSESGYDLTETLSFWVGLSRWSFAALGLAIVAYFVWTYNDPVRQSQEVLQRLQETQAEFRQLLQDTERLLAERALLLQDSGIHANETFLDAGIPEQRRPEETAPQVERQQVAKVWASMPNPGGRRRRSRAVQSPSRQHGRTCRVSAEPLTIPVPLEGALQYNLRRRPCPATPRSPSHL